LNFPVFHIVGRQFSAGSVPAESITGLSIHDRGGATDENISDGYIHCPRLGEDWSGRQPWVAGGVMTQFNLRALNYEIPGATFLSISPEAIIYRRLLTPKSYKRKLYGIERAD